MFGLLKKLLVCSIILSSAIVAYAQIASTKIESPKKHTVNSNEATEHPAQDAKQMAPTVEIAPASKNDEKPKQITEQNGDHTTPDWWLIGVTGVLTIVTGGLVLYSRDTARKELRAYVGIASNHILRGQGESEPNCVEIVIQNFGKTMAKDTKIWINATITTGTITSFPLGDRKSKTVVMPNESLGFKHDIELPKNTAGRIYFWGRIEYTDVFGEPRWTTFSFMDDKPAWLTGMTGQAPGWTTKTCDEGNDAN